MPLADINALFGAPWAGLQRQLVQDLQKSLKGLQVKVDNLTAGAAIKYHLQLRLDDAQLQAKTDAPPGFRGVSTTTVSVALPLDPAGCSLTLTGNVNGFVDVRGIGVKFLSKTFQNEPQQVTLSALRVVADVSSDDFTADLPKLTGIQLSPTMQLNMTGFFNGTLELKAAAANVNSSGACQFQAAIDGLEITSIVNATVRGTVTVTVADTLTLAFSGTVTAGAIKVPVEQSKTFTLPQPVGEMLGLVNAQQTWGEDRPQPAALILPSMDLQVTALAAEDAISEHLPYGAIFDSIYPASPSFPPSLAPAVAPPRIPLNYYGEDDSAIWTGHYLAAEAFRYGSATRKADSAAQTATLQRINQVLDGIDHLFAVPEQAATDAGASGQFAGVFCRAALPADSPVQTVVPLNNPGPTDRHNYYGPVNVNGKEWHGLGRADDPPSRDSYSGLMLGFACAFHFVDDPDVRAKIQTRVTALLNYLLANEWNVPTPSGDAISVGTDGQIETQIKTSFLFQFHHQLAFLRLGRTVDPGIFGDTYDAAARAADYMWLPIWGDCLEPIGKYYKFNIDHACLGMLLLLEDNAELRVFYARALRLLRKTIGHHRNAYFNLWWILVNPDLAAQQAEGSVTGVSLTAETLALLSEWFVRRARVPGANGALMRKETPSPVYFMDLDPVADLGLYHQFGQPDPIVLSRYALPVQYRPGRDLDFCWQRPPFLTGLLPNDEGKMDLTSLDLGQVTQEAPGVDYLLAYWMADYLNLLPA